MPEVSSIESVTLFHDDTKESNDVKELLDVSSIPYKGIFSQKEANWAMPFIFTDANAYRIKGLKEITIFAIEEIRKDKKDFYGNTVQYKSIFITGAGEMWLLESLCGEESVIAAILHSKQATITDALVKKMVQECGIKFFADANDKILSSVDTSLIRSFYGPLRELDIDDCLNRFTLQQLEEAKERQYIKLL